MKLVRLTAPNGTPVFINPDMVEGVRAAGRMYPNAKTEVVLENGSQAVLESVEVVTAKLGV